MHVTLGNNIPTRKISLGLMKNNGKQHTHINEHANFPPNEKYCVYNYK